MYECRCPNDGKKLTEIARAPLYLMKVNGRCPCGKPKRAKIISDRKTDDNQSPALAGTNEPSEIFQQGCGKNGYEIPDAEVFLDRLVRSGVIGDADREMLIATVLEGRLLKDIVPDAREYQRLRKRRQRILLVIRKHTTKSLK